MDEHGAELFGQICKKPLLILRTWGRTDGRTSALQFGNFSLPLGLCLRTLPAPIYLFPCAKVQHEVGQARRTRLVGGPPLIFLFPAKPVPCFRFRLRGRGKEEGRRPILTLRKVLSRKARVTFDFCYVRRTYFAFFARKDKESNVRKVPPLLQKKG